MQPSSLIALLVGVLVAAPVLGTSAHEREVHQAVVEMRAAQGGRVTFSILYNRFQDIPEAREYLARLYEVFFSIPGYLGSEVRSNGETPSLKELSDHFGLTREAAILLLEVMESDPRMPPVLLFDEALGEIESVDLEAIDEFTSAKGTEVRLTGWRGRPLPEFSLPTLDGHTMSERDLIGKAALIVIWLTGCPDCRRTLPNVVKLFDEHGRKGLQVLGFNVDEALGLDRTDSDRREFSDSLGLNFPTVVLDEDTRARFGNLNIYPTMIFVSSEGKIDRLLFNYQEYAVLESIAMGLTGQ